MNNEMKLKVKIVCNDPMKEEMVFIKNSKEKYVAAGMGEEHMSWEPSNPVLMTAQTGGGKNTYFEETILPYTKTKNVKVVIISNRIANNRQSKRRLAKIMGWHKNLEKLTPAGLDDVQSIGNVMILSYQKLCYIFENYDLLEIIKFFGKIGIVVFDEAHFFVSDSLFNSRTEYILQNCIKFFSKAIRIYMTATPDEVFKEIINIEKQTCSNSYTVNCMADNMYAILKRRKILIYNFKRNYKYIAATKYFETADEIIKVISNDRTSQKWVVFVSSKTLGKEICKQLGEIAVFIDASSKDSTEKDGVIYQELVEKEQFSCKAMVSTSVLDNGINIKDSSLTNIVIFTYDKTEFIQMLGRKRIEEGENVTLYICSRSSKAFNGKLNQVNQKISAICAYKKDKQFFMKQYYEKSSENFEIVRGIFYFDKNKLPCLNGFAERKLFNDKRFYEKMKDKFDNGVKEAFILEQLTWVGLQKTYDERNWLNYNAALDQKAELYRFLEKHTDITILDSNTENFYKDFKVLYSRAFGKRVNDRPDRNYGATVIRKIFTELSLNYDLKITNGSLTLVRI